MYNQDVFPDCWNMLSEKDKCDYLMLRQKFYLQFKVENKRNQMNHDELFQQVLNTIRLYAQRGDQNDGVRFFVCGICWIGRKPY